MTPLVISLLFTPQSFGVIVAQKLDQEIKKQYVLHQVNIVVQPSPRWTKHLLRLCCFSNLPLRVDLLVDGV
jgi:hypothetical protein